MQVRFSDSRPEAQAVLSVVLTSGSDLASRAADALSAPREVIDRVIQASRFEAESGSLAELFVPRDGGADFAVLAGLGGEANGDAAEKAGGALVARLLTSGETTLVVDLAQSGLDAEAAARLAFGAVLRAWRHDVYRTRLPAKARPSLETLVLLNAPEGADAAWARLSPVAEGVFLTRSLVAEPANIIYPESFVERCRQLAALGVEIKVLGEEKMRAAGMGALLGVSQGSPREGQLLVMRWNGLGDDAGDPIALVGKGVTFDTGGISIKPAGGMEDMKWDMGGAGAVAGTMMALAGRKARAHVVGVCGLVENMPSGDAQRPGDVVTTMSGQTVEVINTDAEGRLVLCDALTWVQRNYKPKTIVDLATLTGAMIISLGHEYGGLFSNDDSLANQLLAAGTKTGEALWRMPMGPAYDKMIDSPIADMKNVGSREGGSITAAQFLQRFIDEGVRWAHLDIAGTVWAAKPGTLWDKGATGYGVRLLDRFIADNYER